MLKTLLGIAIGLGSCHDVEQVVRKTLDVVRDTLWGDAAAFYLLDHQSGTLALQLAEGFSPTVVEQLRRLRAPMTDEAVRSKRPVAFSVEACPGLTLRRLLQAARLRFLASVPLLARGRTLGALTLGRWTSKAFSSGEFELLEAVGSIVGVALDNAVLYQEMVQQRDRLRTVGILEAPEEQAKRITRDLHDEAVQLVVSTHLAVSEIARELPPPLPFDLPVESYARAHSHS